MDDGAGAHGAGFFGDVEGAAFEAPVADGLLGGGEGEHFRVGGGVAEGFDLVPCAGDDAAFADDDGADGDFVGVECLSCLAEGLAHEVGVAMQIDDGCFSFHARCITGGGNLAKRRVRA